MASRMYSLRMPGDVELWQAMGRVAIRSGHLENMQVMLIKSIAEMTPQEARDSARHMMIREVRERVKKLAKQRQIGELALTKLDAILNRCWKVADERNELMHGLIAEDFDGNQISITKSKGLGPAPTIPELQDLERRMEELAAEINFVRTEGFLAEALNMAPTPKNSGGREE